MLARLVTAVAIALATPAVGRDLTDLERDGFVKAADLYQQAHKNRDAAVLADLLPPGVVVEIVGDDLVGGDDDDEKRRDAMVAAVQEQLDRETEATLKIHPDRVKFAATPDGMPVGLVPMVQVSIRRDGEPIEVRRPVNGQMKKVRLVTEYETTVWSHVLGIFVDGKWSLVSLIDGDAVEALFAVYPVFKELGLPRARSQMHARSVPVE